MFEKCQNCGRRFLFGYKDATGIFCSSVCRDYFKHPGFCEVCLRQTIHVRAGDTTTFNGVGTNFYGKSDQCPSCGSVVRRLFWCLFFVPVAPLGKFRVKYCAPNNYISRRIRRPNEVGANLDMEDEGQILMAEATKLEINGRVEDALIAYQHIAKKYPNTSVGNDAQKSFESLRSQTAGSRDA
jgi:rRNA maturation protein Nop10